MIEQLLEEKQSLKTIYERLSLGEAITYRSFCICVKKMLAEQKARAALPSMKPETKDTVNNDRSNRDGSTDAPAGQQKEKPQPLNLKSFRHNKKPRSFIQAALRRADDKTDG